MVTFAETQRALTADYQFLAAMSGERPSFYSSPSLATAPTGYREFDPAIHDASDIDPLAPLGLALDEDYVREVDKELALHVNVFCDHTSRVERPDITARKAQAVSHIAVMLRAALPYPDDRANLYGVHTQDQSVDRAKTTVYDELFAVEHRQQFLDIATDAARSGVPTVLISDFEGMQIPLKSASHSVGVVVNDITERKVVDSALAVSLGGDYEIHTHDKKQVRAYEELLNEKHERVLAALGQAGLTTVSIITAINNKAGYDEAETDRELAAAFRDIAQRA